jgi:hypothetical protein
MNENKYLLSFEMNENSNLEIHGNQYGFNTLLETIKELMHDNSDNHCHLTAEDLSNGIIGEKNNKIRQVKILYWKDAQGDAEVTDTKFEDERQPQ